MKKVILLAVICTSLIVVFLSVSLISDRSCLNHGLIRMHVVANSDTEEDQQLKLQVRDHILSYLENKIDADCNVVDAKVFLIDHLSKLEQEVNTFLQAQGSNHNATVSLRKEVFDIRKYETFTLPSGVYESLRIEIGQGPGRNWWCVAFPRLCLPTSDKAFEDTAVSAGFSQGLVPTLQQKEGYEIRFLILDILGRIENFFFQITN